jgi:hypothetical protein
MKSIRTLAFAGLALSPLVFAAPSVAQSNMTPPDKNMTGTPGGTTTSETGKTVQTPPTPPTGAKGGESGGSGGK